jgi:glutathione-independent formaldehyde dehydrogenase
MASNRCVVYKGPGKVAVEDIGYPGLTLPEQNRKCDHGVILKIVSTNICGSDQHMVRGRTTAPVGQTLGHEITGEVIEAGRDVEFIKKGDLCSVPFNIACGRCRMCKEGKTGICLNVNPARPGAAYGYVDMGGWKGGQAEYVMIPYADFNLLKFPDLPISSRPGFTAHTRPASDPAQPFMSPARGPLVWLVPRRRNYWEPRLSSSGT